jgi:hypothetical protein
MSPNGPTTVFYVEKRGAYVLERVEDWPPLPRKTKEEGSCSRFGPTRRADGIARVC